MALTILGNCPECGYAVFKSNDYYYDETSDEYWHTSCIPDNEENKGYE